MSMKVKFLIRSNFIKATPKEKIRRVLYILLMGLISPIAVPTMFLATIFDEVIIRLNEWLWS